MNVNDRERGEERRGRGQGEKQEGTGGRGRRKVNEKLKEKKTVEGRQGKGDSRDGCWGKILEPFSGWFADLWLRHRGPRLLSDIGREGVRRAAE